MDLFRRLLLIMRYEDIKEEYKKVILFQKDFCRSFTDILKRESQISDTGEKIKSLYERINLTSCFLNILSLFKNDLSNFSMEEGISMGTLKTIIDDVEDTISDIRALLYSLSESMKSLRICIEKSSEKGNV